MKLSEFLDMWANPSKWIRLFKKDDYIAALTMLKLGYSWQEINEKLSAEMTYNARFMDEIASSFIADRFKKAKVFKFVALEQGLLIFLDI